MSYDSKIRVLEFQYESLCRQLSSTDHDDKIDELLSKRSYVSEQLRELRRLQHESQFVMNMDDYDY